MEAGADTDCPNLPCSTKCLFARASQRWTGCAAGFQGGRRREVKEVLGSNARVYETGTGQSKWARRLHALRMVRSLRQSTWVQREAMRVAATKAKLIVQLAFKDVSPNVPATPNELQHFFPPCFFFFTLSLSLSLTLSLVGPQTRRKRGSHGTRQGDNRLSPEARPRVCCGGGRGGAGSVESSSALGNPLLFGGLRP